MKNPLFADIQTMKDIFFKLLPLKNNCYFYIFHIYIYTFICIREVSKKTVNLKERLTMFAVV